MYPYIVFFHVASVLAFFAAHGASIAVMHALRRERQADRIRALLDVSVDAAARTVIVLLVVVASGVWLGFAGNYWHRGWIWLSLAILAATSIVMTQVSIRYYGAMRIAAGLRPYRRTAQMLEPLAFNEPQYLELLLRPYPAMLKAVGGSAILALLWLMMFKPF